MYRTQTSMAGRHYAPIVRLATAVSRVILCQVEGGGEIWQGNHLNLQRPERDEEFYLRGLQKIWSP